MRITNFEGLRPKDSLRLIPPKGAAVALNLMPSTVEFRPYAADTTVIANTSSTSNPLTIFRLQRNADGTISTNFADVTKWRIHAGDVSYAKLAANNDTTDRHAYTFNDGSAAPRVVDATGNDRQLGVPTPASAPTVTVNVVDEFTVEERSTGIAAARQAAIDAVKASRSTNWRGAAHPGTTTTGYIDRVSTYGTFTPVDSQQLRVYRLTGLNGAVSDPYVSGANAADYSWVFDPQLAPFQGLSNGSPTWSGASNTPHIAIPFAAYGRTYDIDGSALGTALAAIAMPGKSDGTKLLTSDQVSALVGAAQTLYDPAAATIASTIAGLTAKVDELKALLDGGQRGSITAQTSAFYSRTDVAAQITAAINVFASNVFQQAANVARSSLPADFVGGGGA